MIIEEIKFSIIATGYNGEKFVKKCLDSFKAQTIKPFEVILVDDGSTDNSYNEVLKHADPDWVFLKHAKNKGTFYSRDWAINQASGNVIVMVDMDDYLLPNALETCLKKYHEGALMTYGNYKFINGTKCPVDVNYSDEVHANRSYRQDTFRCTHLRTFKKDLYDKIPKWDLTQGEINSYPDAEILFSMMEMCGKDRIGVVEDPIYVYNTANPEATLKRFGKDYPGYYEICNRPKNNLL